MPTEMALTMYSLMASEVAAIKQPLKSTLQVFSWIFMKMSGFLWSWHEFCEFGIKFMKMAKEWGCHEFCENVRIFMELAWILWIWHKVYEDGKRTRMSWILWKCQNFYDVGTNFMNTAHQADQAIFRRPQRSNGLGSRSNIVYFVADLEAYSLTKFRSNRLSRLGGVRGQTHIHIHIYT